MLLFNPEVPMRWRACLVVAAALTAAAAGRSVPAQRQSGVAPPVSARQSLDALLGALRAGEIDRARGMTMSAGDFAGISRRPVEREEYDRRMQGFLRGVARELRAGMKIEQVVLADALILPADRKIEHEVHMAVFHLTYSRKGEPGGGPMPLLLVSHQGRWKLYLR